MHSCTATGLGEGRTRSSKQSWGLAQVAPFFLGGAEQIHKCNSANPNRNLKPFSNFQLFTALVTSKFTTLC